MASFNKVILAGNLTRDPQLSYLPNQTPVCEIGLAMNRKYKTQDGQQKEDTCFVDCTAFGRSAEIINQYMTKGRSILIEGRLNYSQWESKDGQKRNKLRVTIESFQFLGGQQDGQQAQGGQPQRHQQAQGGQRPAAQPSTRPQFNGEPQVGDEGIPF